MIRGEKVDLVAASRVYLEHYHRWMNDARVRDMLGVVNMGFSMQSERQWLEGSTVPKEDTVNLTILTKKGRPIGNIGLRDIDYCPRKASLGIAIGEPEVWDKGYGTDAIRTLLRFAFDELNLHSVHLTVQEQNERAIKCYEKCGFKVEGSQREQRYYQGAYVDWVRMSILRDEWATGRKNACPRRSRGP